MKKLFLVSIAVIVLMVFVGFASQSEAEEILGCYQKNHGQLRIVSSHSECLNSENPITFNQQVVPIEPLCEEIPNLIGTWEGTASVVAYGDQVDHGFIFDEPFSIIITEQPVGHNLFKAETGILIPKVMDRGGPIFGAIFNCYQIRMTAPNAVVFAEFNPNEMTLNGYWFNPEEFNDPDRDFYHPHMGTFLLKRK